ncbi:MAG: CvpA family protein [Lachnospiraceae bacterium]|nr:CvpA family protein [Lachnospiraceae bacterium]MEE1015478.1 CvpA family protein [Lachnospiraceae bacterium]
MNWLFWVVVVFIGYHVIDGLRRGFIRKAVSAISLILTLVLVTYLTPQITTFIQEHTSLYTNLQETCSELFLSGEYNEEVKTDQVLMIENMELPENVKEMLLENNNTEAYDLLEVTGFHDYVGAYLANMIINALAYLITFVIVWTALRAVLLAMDIVTMLPVLHGINKLAGGVLGLAVGIVLVWIVFLLVTILCNGDLGRSFFALISANPFLLFLYNQNVIMKIVFGLIF